MEHYLTFANFTEAQDREDIARAPPRALEVTIQMGPWSWSVITFTDNRLAQQIVLNCLFIDVLPHPRHSLVSVPCIIYTEDM